MSGISSKAASTLTNKYKYNGIEFDEDLGLNVYEAFYRHLDPQTGRWWEIDPKIEWEMENWSPYNSNFNNPIKFSDPKGDCPTCKEIWNDIKDAVKETTSAVYNGAVSVARVVNQANPLASAVEIITGKSAASDFTDTKPRLQAVADLSVNIIMLLTGEIGASGKIAAPVTRVTKAETEIVQRAMSKGELEATKETGLIRGGREGTHHVSDAIGNDAKRVQQRLALPNTPEVKATLEVPKGSFSGSSKVSPKNNMPGGGNERTATGKIPAKVVKVKDL